MITVNRRRGNSCMGVVMGVLMILFGLGAGIFAAYDSYRSWGLVSNGDKVDAVVSDMKLGLSDDNSGRPAAPIFEYTVNGQTYQITSGTESYPPKYKIGDHETLLVDPQNPENARENNFIGLWLLPIILCPTAVTSILGVILVVVITRKRN